MQYQPGFPPLKEANAKCILPSLMISEIKLILYIDRKFCFSVTEHKKNWLLHGCGEEDAKVCQEKVLFDSICICFLVRQFC